MFTFWTHGPQYGCGEMGEPLRGSIQWQIFGFCIMMREFFFEISKNANVHHLIIIGEQINAIDSRV